ncbi:CPBP family intramembrane metalloprotease [Halobacteria archaeon AArc-m2/3/4]|uniref:CPBP family intramembrane metalloprotease n=1 Tax=Natronoglomus mannanivorans TaxID=2979990 RepID=A0AAP2Z0Z1_9EURY|nr:CPBP family intramembrane metalloprotease [Halobacteria archaeon AArc-xg1-1]MCU4972160.1 CPBP family intramembrane metalloprotease [Halobacteria archaeon AArc-m2/3/4]
MDSVEQTDGPVRSLLVAVGLTIGGLLTAELMTLPAFLMDPSLLDAPETVARNVMVTFFILNFLGFFVAGGLYLAYTGRGWSFVDLEMPSWRDWKYATAGIVASIVFMITVSLLAQLANLPAADSQIVEYIGGDTTLVLYLIVIVFLFNAPAEEFLFRNVIQKRLYLAFTRMQAVVATSLVFALVHFPVYAATVDSLVATAVSLTVIFGGSIIFGYIYAKTDNLVVPTLAHAGFNALQFGNLYILLEYYPEEVDMETAMAVGTAIVGGLL